MCSKRILSFLTVVFSLFAGQLSASDGGYLDINACRRKSQVSSATLPSLG